MMLDTDPRRRALAAIMPALTLLCGCMGELRKPLPPEESADFRREAMAYLGRAALSDEPVVRMQALEAFQDCAPGEALSYLAENVDNGYAGVCFAALMAVGTLQARQFEEAVRVRAEDSDPNVRIAALFALHRLGDQRRTAELGELLRRHPDARVRANAALAIGRLGDVRSVRLLQDALRREKKDAVTMQILEALAMLGDAHGIDRLRLFGYSAVPDQAATALMFLANAKPPEAEELFRYRLDIADHPEIKLQAARGLGRLGYDTGLDLSLAYLFFNSPDRNRRDDPPEQQIIRIRALAALALGAIGSPDSLGALKNAFEKPEQTDLVKVAISRAVIQVIDRSRRMRGDLRIANSE